MGTTKFIPCLLSLLCVSTYSSVLYGYKPINHEEDTCKYFDNPLMVPIFKARVSSPKCYPDEFVEETQPLVLPHGSLTFAPRSDIFFADPEEKPKINFADSNIKFGYLPLNENIKSLGDLLELDTEEIGIVPSPPPKRKPAKLWKLDEVKSFAPPKLLPDVVLDTNQNEKHRVNTPNINHAIDPEQIKLGRFVVIDSPPANKVTAQKVGETQHFNNNITNKIPQFKVPEIILSDITPIEDKGTDFMKQLEEIKLSAKATPPIAITEGKNAEPATEHILEVADAKKSVPSSLNVTTEGSTRMMEETTTPKSNVIEKESNKKRRRKKKRSRKRNRKQRQQKENTTNISEFTNTINNEEYTLTNTSTRFLGNKYQKRERTESSVHDVNPKTVTNTSTRFSGNEETFLDGLLSVV